jgi:hypothetical protein
MKALVRLSALMLVLVPAVVSAQEPQPQHPLQGAWRGPMVAGGGEDSEVTLDLRIQGDVVTGPISSLAISDLLIRDGSVTENTIRFSSPSLNPNEPGTLLWTGQLTADNELTFSVVADAPNSTPIEFTLTHRLPPQ